MPLVAHTFRIEQHTLDELESIGDGNSSLGVRRALDKARDRETRIFIWGMLAGLAASLIAMLTTGAYPSLQG